MTSMELKDAISPEETQVNVNREQNVSRFKTDVKDYKESTHYTYDHSSTTKGTSNRKAE